EKIIAIGEDKDILPLASSSTQVLNGNGKWLLPALMDSHTHICEYAERKRQVNLRDCETLTEALSRVTAAVEAAPPGSWIIGGGWDKNPWGESNSPTREHLDRISQQHFIALQSKDWHSLWVNTLVLEKCNIAETSSDPEGGIIHRYPNSTIPSGILQETACRVVYENIPPLTFEEITPLLKKTFQEFHRYGITGIHSVESPRAIGHLHQLHQKGELPLSVFWYFPGKELIQPGEWKYSLEELSTSIHICGIKLFADGALGSQSAAMLSPYEGSENIGIEVMNQEELREAVSRAIKEGWSCAVHAIGDRANRNVLDVFGEFTEISLKNQLRHRVEHAQLLHPDDIPRFYRYQVIASMQPIHLAWDIPNIQKYWGKRGRYAYAFRSLLNSRATLIFGSDAPVETFDPWKGIYTALERKFGVNPANPSYHPEEAITIEEALDAYTRNSAYAVKMENELGTLDMGKQADMILIDQDIFHSPAETLLENRVLLTIHRGNIVYQNY
ncbi:MAG: amidohydrolase, partial [Methanobacteriota archaeon]